MKTVNSLSGGKTSSYLAVHYPADLELFSLCCIDDHNAGKNIDPILKKMANDKLQKYCSHFPEFKATSEDPKILKVMFDLEQMIGREIIWLRGTGWEQMMKIKQAIPNIDKRFCTTILKMIPIFEFLFKYHEFPVKMRMGYRYDEKERAESFDMTFRHPTRCELYKSREEIFGHTRNRVLEKAARETKNGIYYIHRYENFIWRKGDFCLIEDKVMHHTIHEFWKAYNIDFPEDSNCLNCFWKDLQQLRKNFETDSAIMHWAAIQEVLYEHSFKEHNSLLEIKNIGIQLDFFFGTGSGCQAGFCTN